MMSKLSKKYNSDDSKKENGRIPEMSITKLPFNTKRGMSVESYMQNKKIITKICPAPSVETQKNFMQRPTNCYSEKKLYPCC